ncbi:MAG: hypothetical protein Q9219_003029 [cf. Caloplaca sp. 3 TL-2023]
MEQSPVISAQNHARNAANASNPAAAGTEHEHAATHFAAAADGTKHPEALRTLRLLEQHHQKLADLLKFRSNHPPANPQIPIEPPSPNHVPLSNAQQQREGSSHPSQPQTVSLPQRDISSSIASNLASARGIPSNRQRRSQPPSLSPQTSKPDAINPSRRSKLIEGTYQSRLLQDQKPRTSDASNAPSVLPTRNKPATPSTLVPEHATLKSEEPFQKFYSTFESLFSKLSAPLAFAGLPLNPDEPSSPPASNSNPASTKKSISSTDHPPAPKARSSRPALEASQRASADPDYSALFSRAALRAVADEHGPGSVGANESFYVVPTSGHTLAYADILARQRHERTRSQRGHLEAEDEEDDDLGDDEGLFVDARETPGPPSPEISRKRGQGRVGDKTGAKTMEELQLENQAMKALLDQTSRRLLEFEMSAQTSSVALQRSIRQLNAHSAEAGAGGNLSRETEERLKAMEEQVLAKAKEMTKMERENEKLKGVVGRYRDRFETIKAGARARREESSKKSED